MRSRLKLIEAATSLFAARGFDGTSMRDIADAAGLSLGLVARYFPTREHFAFALYDRLADELASRAVELPSGSVASRFTALMKVRIAQCEANRRPLTALLGPALDPQSPLYALGAETETTRARVHGALAVVVAGASDAPSSSDEAARLTQLLYTVHLGVVLAALSQKDASRAHAVVEQFERGLGFLRLPLVKQFVGRLLLDKPRAAGRERDTAREILEVLFRDNRVLPGVEKGLTGPSEALHRPNIEAVVRAGQPLELVLPAFPAKAPNEKKVLGALPDLAEERALERLSELLDELSGVYAPGARLTICSDGHVFSDLVGVSDGDVDRYRDALLRMVDDPRVRWFELSTALGDEKPAKLRAHLLEKYAATEDELRARAAKVPALAAQLDGIHRFLFEDEVVLHPELTKSQAKKQTRARAYEVVLRSEAWGALVAHTFPQAVRLSIHPQPDPSVKIGLNLLGVRDPWLTPWHACAVVARGGTTLMHRAQAEAAGAVVAYTDGRPTHLELELR
ncbi:MAG: L-tyrosine/L-tryptophan isonitrile synthase family protein [Archangium sp.]|nr:L-tyrosine/L-tryptophan isonitrile synthase family protein [Archangium sp.]